MSAARLVKRLIRAHRQDIKRALPFQGFDALARRRSFAEDMAHRGLTGQAVPHSARVTFRLVTLASDPAMRYLPATGAP